MAKGKKGKIKAGKTSGKSTYSPTYIDKTEHDNDLIDASGVMIKNIHDIYICYDVDRQRRVRVAAFDAWRRCSPETSRRMTHVAKIVVLAPVLFGAAPVDQMSLDIFKSYRVFSDPPKRVNSKLGKDAYSFYRIVGFGVESFVDMLNFSIFSSTLNAVEELMKKRKTFADVMIGSDADEWIGILTQKISSCIDKEPWYRPSLINDSQLSAVGFVIGKVYASLILMSYSWGFEADFDLFWEMFLKKSPDTIRFKNRGNKYYKQCVEYDGADGPPPWDLPMAIYTLGLRDSQFSAVLYCNRSLCFLKDKKYEEAMSDALRTIILEPEWSKGHFRLGESLYRLGRYNIALFANLNGNDSCKNNLVLNKKEDLENLSNQSKSWTKHNSRQITTKWDCDMKECPSYMKAKLLSAKLMMARALFKNLLIDKLAITLDEGENRWADNKVEYREHKVDLVEMSEMTFEDAFEMIKLDPMDCVVFFTHDNEDYMTLRADINRCEERFGNVTWHNGVEWLVEKSRECETDDGTENEEMEPSVVENFKLESLVANRNAQVNRLKEELKSSQESRKYKEIESETLASLVKAIDTKILESEGSGRAKMKKAQGEELIRLTQELADTKVKLEASLRDADKLRNDLATMKMTKNEIAKREENKLCLRCKRYENSLAIVTEKEQRLTKEANILRREANKVGDLQKKIAELQEENSDLTKDVEDNANVNQEEDEERSEEEKRMREELEERISTQESKIDKLSLENERINKETSSVSAENRRLKREKQILLKSLESTSSSGLDALVSCKEDYQAFVSRMEELVLKGVETGVDEAAMEPLRQHRSIFASRVGVLGKIETETRHSLRNVKSSLEGGDSLFRIVPERQGGFKKKLDLRKIIEFRAKKVPRSSPLAIEFPKSEIRRTVQTMGERKVNFSNITQTMGERKVNFDNIIQTMAERHPRIPRSFFVMVFSLLRHERGKLSGLTKSEIVNNLEEKLNWIVNDFTDVELEFIHRGALSRTSAPQTHYEKKAKDPESEKEDCPICLDELNDPKNQISFNCRHKFHPECISTWLKLKNECPTCRTILVNKSK